MMRTSARPEAQSISAAWRHLALCCGLAALAGCGNTIYAVEVNSAASKLEEAESLGAEQYAPYEFYAAKQHLEKARTEAAEADYGDAIDLASTSGDFSDKAIRIARNAHRGAGR